MKIAVILSGCGHKDGAEIREAVLTLLYLDQAGAEAQCFAPDIPQASVINHLTGQETGESRNVLAEAARIARGEISPLSQASAKDFDGIILPGGFGAAKNLSDLAFKGKEAKLLPELEALLLDFHAQGKPIGAICIAPAVLAAALGRKARPLVTIGEDEGTAKLVRALGAEHQNCPSESAVTDEKNRIATCPAYMREDRLSAIAQGIERVVKEVVRMGKKNGLDDTI